MGYKVKRGRVVKDNKPKIESLADLLQESAYIIIKQNPNHGYTQTDFSKFTANKIIQHCNLNCYDTFRGLSRYRELIDQRIDTVYGLKLRNDWGVMCDDYDPEVEMKAAGVPQDERIMVGLMDTIISQVAIKIGVVQVFDRYETA